MASREEVAQVFPTIVERFDPKKAAGLNVAIQFDLSGDNGGLYWLLIENDKAETGEGKLENAKMTLKASGDDFYNMLKGTINPMQAFMTGKIKIQGDTSLALKLMPLINAM